LLANVTGKRLFRKQVFLLTLGLLGLVMAWMAFRYPGGPVALADSLPGAPSGDSRLALAQETFDLILDYRFTGGGLGSFPGLFSQYIMGMPVFLFGYSHNMYLDVALELGMLGLLAFLFVLASTGWNLAKLVITDGETAVEPLFLGAIVVSFLIFLFHGLVDDAVFGMRGTPILFSWMGMVLAIRRSGYFPFQQPLRENSSQFFRGEGTKRGILLLGTALLAAIALAVFFAGKYEPLMAGWYANLGAIRFSQVNLIDFPSGKWDEGNDLEALKDSKSYFERALSLDPWNHTANYRMGLIALLEGDYSAAVSHLESAYLQRPSHRGIRKTLGFSYVWVGDYQKARLMLGNLPEALRELHFYQGWWNDRGREDLANQALTMMAFIEKSGN
jgi:hypothetical protein